MSALKLHKLLAINYYFGRRQVLPITCQTQSLSKLKQIKIKTRIDQIDAPIIEFKMLVIYG